MAFPLKGVAQLIPFVWDKNQSCASVLSRKHIILQVPEYPGKLTSSDGTDCGAELLKRTVKVWNPTQLSLHRQTI